jgi:hypothetical protein
MGMYMDKVREGIKEWVSSPASESSRAMDGFYDLYTLFMKDDNFTQAVMDGAEEIDTSFGFLTEEALTQFVEELDSVAINHGGRYEALLYAYHNNPDQIKAALATRDLDTIDVVYNNFDDSDVEYAVALVHPALYLNVVHY